MNLVALILLIGCLYQMLAVDKNKFRKCQDTGFCRRNRNNQPKCTFFIKNDPIIKDKRVDFYLSPSNIYCQQLTYSLYFLSNGVIRSRVVESFPLGGVPRWEDSDILVKESLSSVDPKLIPQSELAKYNIKYNDGSVYYTNDNDVVEINKKDFIINIYKDGNLLFTLNEGKKFYFEYTRLKVNNNQATENSLQENKETKKIVSYTEAGEAVYEDGTIDRYESNEVLPPSTNDDGEWEESFGGFTDTKPNGPQSVGLDLKIHDIYHVYGLPSHASSFAMTPTMSGHGGHDEPYRLYNLDVFEFENNSPAALYGSIPFIIGGGKQPKAVFFMNPTEAFVDISRNQQNKIDTYWMFEAGIVDLFLFTGPDYNTIYSQYHDITAYAPIPPYFSLGYHQCRWNYNSQQDVIDVNNKFNELDFPYDFIWLDIEHTDGKRYFTYNSAAFPDPKAMQTELFKTGHRMVNIIDPHIKADSNYHVDNKIKERNLYLRDARNNMYEGHCWSGTSHYVDYLHPDAQLLWDELMSYDSYPSTPYLFVWNDMNEPSVFNGPEVSIQKDAKTAAGLETRYFHNIYGYHYNKVNYVALIHRNPDHNMRPFVLTRSYFAGSHRFSAVWTGDIFSSFEALKQLIPMVLSASIAGFSFVGGDTPGFFKNPTPELYSRWYQAAIWSPFFRAHAHLETMRREPWTQPEETYNITKRFVQLRYSYNNYYYTLFYIYHKTGIPILRPLFMYYPDDVYNYDTEELYLVGRDILIYPIVIENKYDADIRFPGNDKWYHLETHESFSGRRAMPFPIDQFPMFQRAGSIIVRKMRHRRSTEFMLKDPFSFDIIPDSQGEARGNVYVDDYLTFNYINKNEYCYKDITMVNNVITSKTNGNCSYNSTEYVERIEIIDYKLPKRVSITDSNGSRELTFSFENKILIIRKPESLITDDWTITIEL